MVARREETPTVPRSEESVETKLHRIAEKARKEPSFKFTSLYHLMNEELLRGCFKWLRKDAAAGIDNETKETYAANLDANLSDLIGRLHRMAYIPQAVRRTYIPKPGCAKQRPLGIPCFEDKLVQAGNPLGVRKNNKLRPPRVTRPTRVTTSPEGYHFLRTTGGDGEESPLVAVGHAVAEFIKVLRTIFSDNLRQFDHGWRLGIILLRLT